MYVLTEGWYSDTEVKGVTDDLATARAWQDSDMQREYYGPFTPGLPA